MGQRAEASLRDLATRISARSLAVPPAAKGWDASGTLPPALVLRDGRRYWRQTVPALGSVTPKAEALIARAKADGFGLGADGLRLGVVARPGQADLVGELLAHAADVLAALHRDSDRRLGIAE